MVVVGEPGKMITSSVVVKVVVPGASGTVEVTPGTVTVWVGPSGFSQQTLSDLCEYLIREDMKNRGSAERTCSR